MKGVEEVASEVLATVPALHRKQGVYDLVTHGMVGAVHLSLQFPTGCLWVQGTLLTSAIRCST